MHRYNIFIARVISLIHPIDKTKAPPGKFDFKVIEYMAHIVKFDVCLLLVSILLTWGCSSKKADPSKADNITTSAGQQVKLPAPYQTGSVRNYCKVIGWPDTVKRR